MQFEHIHQKQVEGLAFGELRERFLVSWVDGTDLSVASSLYANYEQPSSKRAEVILPGTLADESASDLCTCDALPKPIHTEWKWFGYSRNTENGDHPVVGAQVVASQQQEASAADRDRSTLRILFLLYYDSIDIYEYYHCGITLYQRKSLMQSANEDNHFTDYGYMGIQLQQ